MCATPSPKLRENIQMVGGEAMCAFCISKDRISGCFYVGVYLQLVSSYRQMALFRI